MSFPQLIQRLKIRTSHVPMLLESRRLIERYSAQLGDLIGYSHRRASLLRLLGISPLLNDQKRPFISPKNGLLGQEVGFIETSAYLVPDVSQLT